MKTDNLKQISKFISLVLRHEPEAIGITLDVNGWVDVETLMERMCASGKRIDRKTLEMLVETNDKQRFAFSEDGMRIRANQGHSVEVDLALEPSAAPEFLYHGTATRFESSVRSEGLIRKARQHVHLSGDIKTALNVGQRHGKPCLLTIRAQEMERDGYVFYCSKNGVWLTDRVPLAYIDFPQENE